MHRKRAPHARRWRDGLAVLAGALALSAVAARPAAATSYGLFVGNTFTVNGLSLTVTGCTLTLASVVQSSCGTSNANAYAEVTALAGTAAALKVDRNLTGGDLFSVASGGPNGKVNELLYTLSMTPPAHNALSSVASVLAGTSSASAGNALVADTTKIYNGATPVNTLTPTGALLGSQALNLATTTATTSLVGTYPVALSVTTDLKLTSSFAYSLKLSSVAQTYSFGRAPEPVSIGLFLVGLGGLGLARRARRRGAV